MQSLAVRSCVSVRASCVAEGWRLIRGVVQARGLGRYRVVSCVNNQSTVTSKVIVVLVLGPNVPLFTVMAPGVLSL